MGRGSKEGSGQKTRGERQQLQKEERSLLRGDLGRSPTPHSGLDSSERSGEHHTTLPPLSQSLAPHTHPGQLAPRSPARTCPALRLPHPLPLALVPGATAGRKAPSSKKESLKLTHTTSLLWNRSFKVYHPLSRCSYLSLQQALITLTMDEETEAQKSFRTPSLRFCPLHRPGPQGPAGPDWHSPSRPPLSGSWVCSA